MFLNIVKTGIWTFPEKRQLPFKKLVTFQDPNPFNLSPPENWNLGSALSHFLKSEHFNRIKRTQLWSQIT